MVPVMIPTARWNRHVLPVLGAGIMLFPAATFGAGQKFEKHFTVKGRPVVSIQNVANGRIEVKSSKTQEVVVTGSQLSNKIGVETEQAGFGRSGSRAGREFLACRTGRNRTANQDANRSDLC